MNEPFLIPLTYLGTEHEFKARYERWGYTHRISVLIDGSTVSFEPDEEGFYRALGTGVDLNVQPGLLRALADKLRELTS